MKLKAYCSCQKNKETQVNKEEICIHCGHYAVMGKPYRLSTENFNGEVKRKYKTDDYSLPTTVSEQLLEKGLL